MELAGGILTIIQGDLESSFTVTVKRNGEAQDLTGKAVRMIVKNKTTTLIDRNLPAYDAENGVVLVAFQAGETDTVGNYIMYFSVIHSGDRPETYKAKKTLKFNVVGI